MVFEANEFLKAVASVKSFWLKSRFNELRIEAYKEAKKMNFVSIDRDSGLETVVTVPAYVAEDTILYAKAIKGFYDSVKVLQQINVGENNPLKLRLIPSREDKSHYTLEVVLTHWNFVASKKK